MGLRYGWITLILLSGASAAELKQETVTAWDQYVQAVDGQMKERLGSARNFLWTDEMPDRGRRLHEGEILVAPMVPHNPQRVPNGLIHHWIGAAFVPNIRLGDVLAVLRDYARYKDYYHPAVIASAPVQQTGYDDQYQIVMMNSSFLKSAIAIETKSSYVEVDASRWYCISRSDRVQAIENYGKSEERRLPSETGPGYLWRVHSITRLVERDGGVYVEVEALALSRDIPGSLRWVVDPIVRRVSKGAIATTLQETEDAVNGAASAITALPTVHGSSAYAKR